MKRFTGIFTVFASALFFFGCTVSKDLASEAVGLNKAVERAENKLLLLNIVRASKRQPMYFTGFTGLSGTSGISSGTVGLKIPFGGDAAKEYTFTPGLKLSPGVTYNVGILQTHKFMRGILKPLDPGTVKYYWDQGWPEKLLLYLFVEKIVRLERKGGKVFVKEKFINDPQPYDTTAMNKFAKEIDRLVDKHELGLFYKDSTIIKRQGDNKEGKKEKIRKVMFSVEPKRSSSSFSDTTNSKYRLIFQPELAINDQENGSYAVVYLRSPQSIIYYLGEIIRSQTNGDVPSDYPAWPFFVGGGKRRPIIYVEKVSHSSGKDTYVNVKYDGETYVIPKQIPGEGYNDNSMQTLALVMQLIGQYKSSEDLPATSTFRLIEN